MNVANCRWTKVGTTVMLFLSYSSDMEDYKFDSIIFSGGSNFRDDTIDGGRSVRFEGNSAFRGRRMKTSAKMTPGLFLKGMG